MRMSRLLAASSFASHLKFAGIDAVRAYRDGSRSRMTAFVSRYGIRPSRPPSRPMPDCLKPPKANA